LEASVCIEKIKKGEKGTDLFSEPVVMRSDQALVDCVGAKLIGK
jgi:hypothetical protein